MTWTTVPAGQGAGPHTPLDAEAVQRAYRRLASSYDVWFGLVTGVARRRTVAVVNAAPGRRVLEVGVGTGLALPLYDPSKRVHGIDLSAAMLEKARARVERVGLAHVEAIEEMDAEAMTFGDASFDVAVAMFVASVVPRPWRLAAEMRRVVRPGGLMLFVNHFRAGSGPRWWTERALAPASRLIGWHPDFPLAALLAGEERAAARLTPMPPLGLFTLVELGR